jgi:hypothetical protein
MCRKKTLLTPIAEVPSALRAMPFATAAPILQVCSVTVAAVQKRSWYQLATLRKRLSTLVKGLWYTCKTCGSARFFAAMYSRRRRWESRQLPREHTLKMRSRGLHIISEGPGLSYAAMPWRGMAVPLVADRICKQQDALLCPSLSR